VQNYNEEYALARGKKTITVEELCFSRQKRKAREAIAQ